MIRKVLLSAALVCGPLAMAATGESLLKTAWDDPIVQSSADAESIAHSAQGFNPINKAEVRLQRGYLDDRDRRLGFRVYLKGLSEFRDYRRYEASLENNETILSQQSLSTALLNRYQILSKIAYLKRKQELTSELITNARKTQAATSYTAQRDQGQIKTFLRSKAELQKVELKAAELRREVNELNREMKDFSQPTIANFDMTDLVAGDDIRARLEDPARNQDTRSLSAEKARTELERSLAALSYQRSQQSKWFDYLEISERENDHERVYGIRLGFLFPVLAAPDLSHLDSAARHIRAQGESRDKLRAASREGDNLREELRNLLDLQRSLTDGKGQMNGDELRRAGQIVARQDPLLAIELQKSWFDAQEQLVQLDYQIRNLYLRYLHETSRLGEMPDVNYLSKSLRKIR